MPNSAPSFNTSQTAHSIPLRAPFSLAARSTTGPVSSMTWQGVWSGRISTRGTR
ncbi:hypothetical protein BDZ97DRAFT_1828334 [Flammula alnicola]|nr:hypothetical protein BDZ97DRAFT_1828334 [Flammula alnicola]